MTRTLAIVIGLVLLTVGGMACKKKSPAQDGVFMHTPESIHQKIQEVRLHLTKAVQQKNLQYVHDNMFYFKALLQSLFSSLQGEKKERVDDILSELVVIAEEIDNSAGRGNQAATEVNLQKLIDKLKILETEFKTRKR